MMTGASNASLDRWAILREIGYGMHSKERILKYSSNKNYNILVSLPKVKEVHLASKYVLNGRDKSSNLTCRRLVTELWFWTLLLC